MKLQNLYTLLKSFMGIINLTDLESIRESAKTLDELDSLFKRIRLEYSKEVNTNLTKIHNCIQKPIKPNTEHKNLKQVKGKIAMLIKFLESELEKEQPVLFQAVA